MTRFSLTTIISLFALVSFGQIKANKDSLLVNPSSIKVTLLGTGTPQPIMERFGPVFLFKLAVKLYFLMQDVVVYKGCVK